MTNNPNDVRVSRVGAAGKYDEVLKPFMRMMENELHANAGKGDRSGWLKMSAETCLLEIYYHQGKLQKAVKDGDGDRIVEYAADVANLAMMLTDICGALNLFAAAQPADQQGEPVAWRGCNADGEVVTDWIDGSPPRRMVDLSGNQDAFDKIELVYAQPATAKVDEKAEFEQWADRHFASADYSCNYAGVYLKDWMRHSFASWQARAKLNTKQ
ncbi:hypothetical protein JTE78_12205 [Pseudomonas syringae pv. aptata]|uniref:hypothetical protein n=1 Tax=Pseudomonas syringae TaxID=317 RepID=UPI00204229FE|nr:hypothetical protein [Pseudomonas syringae]MCK0543525.1 hypothetical protein [Pseudomonas syringae pv. aptata]